MIKYIVLIIATHVAIIMISCKKDAEPVTEIVVDIDMPALSDSAMSGKFTNGRFLVLKGAMISKIDRLVSWSTKYVILDKQQKAVSIFDSTGNIIKQIQRIGRGPGEYIQIQDCSIDNENNILMIYADQPGKVLFFDSDGQYLQETAMKNCFYEISNISNKMFGYNCSPNKENNYTVKEFIIPTFTQSVNIAHSVREPIDFTSGKIFYSDKEQVWMSPPGQSFIYEYDIDANDFTAKYCMNYGDSQMPDDFSIDTKDPMVTIQYAIKNKIILHTSDICKIGNLLLFKANNKSFMLNTSTNEVSKIGIMAAPLGVKAILASPSYIPMSNQNSKYVTQVSASLLMDYEKKAANKTMIFDELVLELSRQNAQFANPILMIYETK